MKISQSSPKVHDYLTIAKTALYILGIIVVVYMTFKAIHEFLWICHYAGIPM